MMIQKKLITTLLILATLVFTGCNNIENTGGSNSKNLSVHYDGNGNTGGSVPTDSNTYQQDAIVTVKSLGDLTHSGYSFTAWNTLADGNGTSYSPDETFQIGTTNVTLYAKWKDTSITPDPVAPDTRIAITITTKEGGDVTLTKAPLLYNKQHVLTMENDDSLNEPYTTFLPLFNGGTPILDTVPSAGMFMTDGCTNDIPYKSNVTGWVIDPSQMLDWYAWSDGSHWLDYAQLDTLMANGFGLVDHGYYTNMANPIVDPVTAVDNYVTWAENRYGFRPLYAVAPGGVVFDTTAWKNRWFEKGLRFIVIASGGASAMTRVDNINITTFSQPLQVGRYNIETLSSSAMMAYVTTMVASPGNQWLRFFGHLIHMTDFIIYPNLKAFFTQFNTLYGKPGNDSIWVANIDDLISYLYCRDTITLDSVKEGNKTTFYIDESAIPSYVRHRLITFKVVTTDQILDIHVSGETTASMSSSLINVLWKK